ncbi:hypothetical protein Dimus_037979 [Dionaea muscipula]
MASFGSNQQQFVPSFNGESYDFWSIKMSTVLRAYDLWEIVEKGVPQTVDNVTPQASESLGTTPAATIPAQGMPTSVATQMKEWLKKDAEALAKIHHAVTDSIFPRIMNATTAKQAWDVLKEEFQGTTKDVSKG